MATSPVSLTGFPPTSQIMSLPQLGGMTFSITTNGGWYDILNFAPVSLVNINWHAELRKTPGDAQNILNLSSTASPPQIINGGANGLLFLSADASLFANITPGIYVMDMLATDVTSGIVRNLCEGGPMFVTVIQGITR